MQHRDLDSQILVVQNQHLHSLELLRCRSFPTQAPNLPWLPWLRWRGLVGVGLMMLLELVPRRGVRLQL